MLKVNGIEIPYPGSINILEWLEKSGYRPDRTAVERNEKIVPRAMLAKTMLNDGDCLEVVSFVGGG